MITLPDLRTSLLDLLRELQGSEVKLIIGGGLGIYLKIEHVRKLGVRTLLREWPEARSTNDLDLFLRPELLVHGEKLKPLASAIEKLGYEVIPEAAKYQFVKRGKGRGEAGAIKLDLLTGPESRFAGTAGKPNARLNWQEAEKRADALQTRLQKRLDELRLEAQIFPLPPVVLGGVVIVPQGLLSTVAPHAVATPGIPADTQASAARARAAVMDVERRLGFLPVDREADKLGYDIESKVPGTGKLRFIEVKGRIAGADTITVTRNEILYSLNKPDDFILAIVEFDGDKPPRPRYVRRPFQKDVEFSVTSVNYNMADLLARAEEPA